MADSIFAVARTVWDAITDIRGFLLQQWKTLKKMVGLVVDLFTSFDRKSVWNILETYDQDVANLIMMTTSSANYHATTQAPALGRYIAPIVVTSAIAIISKFTKWFNEWREKRKAAKTRSGGDSHGHAKSVTSGGTGKAFAGHGTLEPGSGKVVVPEGTSITIYSEHDVLIPDEMGKLIEAGKYDEVFANKDWADKWEGAATYHPGAKIPDYTLHEPTGLNIYSNSMTVTEPKRLSQILAPNMGNVDWAACTEDFSK